MATPKSQRIGIWIITIVMVVGALASFLAMGLSVKNSSTDSTALQSAYTKYEADIAAQTKELSDKYYTDFSQYASVPAAFTASDVTELKTADLVIGTGDTITADTTYNAYYIGWNPKGVIFDQSISDGALKAPIASSGLIEGWSKGVVGMKLGGVRELTIPSDLAYKSAGSGDNIPADTPLKFIVMAIPKIDDIAMPEILQKYYMSLYSSSSN